MNQRGNRAAQRGMAAILVVVDIEVLQQLAQMIETTDDGDALQPLVLQREDDAFGDRDGTMLADRAEPLLHIPQEEQVTEGIGDEDFLLIAGPNETKPVTGGLLKKALSAGQVFDEVVFG